MPKQPAIFVGRERELSVLVEVFGEVRSTGRGQIVAVRGRRQVGKSTLIEVFSERSGAPVVYFQAARHRTPALEIGEFQRLALEVFPGSELLASSRFTSWDGALGAVAALADEPVIVVIDEMPWLVEGDPSVEGSIQRVLDRTLRRRPVLVVLVGSDLAVMEALSDYGRPLYDRARILAVDPLSPSEVSSLIGGTATECLDAYIVAGGFPNLVNALRQAPSVEGFIASQLADPTSVLVVSGERRVAAEFPAHLHARAVLGAIGAGEREHGSIASSSGVGGSMLERSLELLVAKRVVSKRTPYSSEPGRRRSRYVVADPALRFWLRSIGPALAEIERGRGPLVARRVLDDFATFRGQAIEPIVREALTRMLPDDRFGSARSVGGYWTRDQRVEVDLVGGHEPERTDVVEFIGSIKWRERSPFDRHDLVNLATNQPLVPGTTAQTHLLGISRSGFATNDLDIAIGPDDLVAAW